MCASSGTKENKGNECGGAPQITAIYKGFLYLLGRGWDKTSSNTAGGGLFHNYICKMQARFHNSDIHQE